MDKIAKFLKKLSKKRAKEMRKILLAILSLSLEGYDVKTLKGSKGFDV